MAILSPKPDPQMPFFANRLTPLASDHVMEMLGMSHIFVAAAGLSQLQINAVRLSGTQVSGLWRRLLGRRSGGRS